MPTGPIKRMNRVMKPAEMREGKVKKIKLCFQEKMFYLNTDLNSFEGYFDLI